MVQDSICNLGPGSGSPLPAKKIGLASASTQSAPPWTWAMCVNGYVLCNSLVIHQELKPPHVCVSAHEPSLERVHVFPSGCASQSMGILV